MWVDFLDAVRRALGLRVVGFDPVAVWRKVREPVLENLDRLGLVVIVERTDGETSIERHAADLAGLVRVHRRGATPRPLAPERTGLVIETYRRRMAELHGLLPDDSLPTTLRGFVGQSGPAGAHDLRPVSAFVSADAAERMAAALARYIEDLRAASAPVERIERAVAALNQAEREAAANDQARRRYGTGDSVSLDSHPYRPRWLDHVHAWRDRDGDAVLTVEPYGDLLAAEPTDYGLATVVEDVDGLGLVLDGGLRPGVWNNSTTLLIWRYDPNAEVPPAEHRPRTWSSDEGWVTEL